MGIFPQSLYKFTRIYISRGLFGSSCPKHASLYSQLRNRASKHPRYLTMATTMQKANRLKVAFDEGKGPSMGCWQMIPGSNVSRTLSHINRLPAAIQRRDPHHGANRNKRSPPRR